MLGSLTSGGIPGACATRVSGKWPIDEYISFALNLFFNPIHNTFRAPRIKYNISEILEENHQATMNTKCVLIKMQMLHCDLLLWWINWFHQYPQTAICISYIILRYIAQSIYTNFVENWILWIVYLVSTASNVNKAGWYCRYVSSLE